MIDVPLSRENIAPRVATLVRDCFGINPQTEIEDDTSICNDLGADSLDLVELAMNCEDEFGIEIFDDAARGIKTIGGLIDLIFEAKPTA